MWRWYLLQGGPGSLGSVQQTEYDSRQGEWELRKCQTVSQCQCDGETKSEVRIWPSARSGGHRAQQVGCTWIAESHFDKFPVYTIHTLHSTHWARRNGQKQSYPWWCQVSADGKDGKHNLVLGEPLQIQSETTVVQDQQGWDHGRDWSLGAPHIAQVQEKILVVAVFLRTCWSHLFSFSQPLNGDDFYQLRRWCF